MCKDPYGASNQWEFEQQILSYSNVQDWLALRQSYEAKRTQAKVRLISLVYFTMHQLNVCLYQAPNPDIVADMIDTDADIASEAVRLSTQSTMGKSVRILA